jgi:Photosynthesis system II assembly factor YCF48
MYYRKVRLRITAAVGTFVSLASMNFGIVPSSTNAQSSSRPYVILVNGYEDCCVYDANSRGIYMGAVREELEKSGAEFRLVPWNGFEDGGKQKGRTSNDAAFLSEAADFINNKLDPDRPLVMIGHSFGGDSLLSLAPRINRRIQFLGVIDPVAAGGLRQPVTGRGVSSNVDYFFNRWQRNGLNSSNVVPFDSRIVNGSISNCQAKTCDQEEQNLSRNSDGSEIRVSCGRLEVSCPGYQPWPGGSNGTKAKRLAHNDMPLDQYLQRQIADKVLKPSTIANSSNSVVRDTYFTSANVGTTVGNNGVILRTGDGGASWVSQNSQVSRNLNAVHFTSENVGTAVGNNGVILRTGDGGASWVSQNSQVSQNLNAIHFTSENIGTAVGNNGVILRTGDGGASWVSQNSRVSQNLNSVHFTSENIGTAVGNNGVILRTGDGGASWVSQNQ